MPVVAFYSKGTSLEIQDIWEKRLKFYFSSITLTPLFSEEAKLATSALLWKAPLDNLTQLRKVKGLISLGQGVDHILNKNQIPKNIPVVRIVDPYMARSMSHWVLLSVLNIIRETYGYFSQENKKIYKPRDEKDFSSVRIGVYGVGAIGSVVAKDLSYMGFNVQGWSRTKKNIKTIKCLYGSEGFNELITLSDVHVCLLPLTSSTVNIFNKDIFIKMKKGSCFINAGRGEHVIEDDLLNSCKSRHISNAVLDVYRNEPLPKNHPFWQQDNIRLWPHVAAETNPDTAAKQIANAIKCIDNNVIPPNTVDRVLGY
ncbi:glyoxylate/hydroxypyruvate reductase A [Alphaproteobacteria bacterium]|jgi:glyoxylate/hydroxypyruvate reductase A|nr:glyoxylate/hydroxypyruvate reductase A [Alphaproteobacteria bacterium]